MMQPLRDETKRLSDLLGDDHDLAVLRNVLTDETDRFGSVRNLQTTLALLDQRRKELQAWAHPLGERIYADKPGRFSRRLGRYWQAWYAERNLTTTIGDRS
jgi:hypothetical protein